MLLILLNLTKLPRTLCIILFVALPVLNFFLSSFDFVIDDNLHGQMNPANESTRRRVMFYTIAEYVAFMAASALQVVYIRRLFSKNVGYNRV
jgi:hypothetical protein